MGGGELVNPGSAEKQELEWRQQVGGVTLCSSVCWTQRAEELEGQLKEKDCELLKRDRVITDLRIRLPASADRDAVFEKVASQSSKSPRDEDYESSQAVKVATSTVSSLQVAVSSFICLQY